MTRVAIVEPDAQLAALLREWLAGGGAELVDPGDGGAAAVEVLVIDVGDPRVAHERIDRWRKAVPDAAIIATSARVLRSCAEGEDAARRLGVARVLPKPFTRDDLWNAIAQALRTHRCPTPPPP